ncbi:polysaccharide biosynthesis/export family protein [Akkermansiaceae bacterium]|nr:polysaccharide biosynthesis/export family protein [Akkermansiaceae bacterium]
MLFSFILGSIASISAEIKNGDVLDLVIKGVPAKEKTLVDGQYVVEKSGKIKIPLADVMVQAKGLSHGQLSRAIEGAFKEKGIYLRPTITVRGARERSAEGGAQLSVGGKVKRPGPVPCRERMTVLQAIQAAGDFDPFATKKRVYLTRDDKTYLLDLRKPEHQNYRVKAEDTLRVDAKRPFETE